MALTRVTVDREADAIATICEEMAYLLTRIEWIIDHNSNMAIDWAAEVKPAYIEEDAALNLVDRTFSRQNVANAIYSLLQVKNVLLNTAAVQGDHLGTINQMCRPLRRGQ